ncbi:cytochrome P450 CYP82D47-like isoform X1 [Tasmannia lanceolata]|uniref:cytochrome P450 CYP82D47-like isoform X1 n=1 Tax=Tasmannia lanceolata TaxID=3420 RepID=UPI004062B3DD
MDFILHMQSIAGLIAVVLLYKLWIARTKSRSKEAPEAAGAWPVIGHLHLLGRGAPLFRTLGVMADKYGPTFTIWLGMRRTLIVSSWEVCKECFTTNDKVLADRPTFVAGELLGYNYAMFGFAPYGPYWREIRKIATLEVLSNRRLELLKHIRVMEIDMCIRDLYGVWVKKNRQPVMVEMKQWFGNLTMNVVVKMVTGKRYTGGEGDDQVSGFRHALSQFLYLTSVFVLSDALPFLKWMDLQGYEATMKKTSKEIDFVLSNWVEEHRRRRISNQGGHVDQDFVDVMLSIVDGANISNYDSDTIIKATCLSLILGGTDTTAVTLAWALSLLLNNSHVLKKAQDELDIHVGKDRHVDESDINNLVYLQAIFKETMRLYPAPLAVPHSATEDCQVDGFHVPAGTLVMVNLWKLQRDPRVWSDPLEFRPERFLTSHVDVDVRGQHFEYIPFGSGRRSCPGISFALQVMHLALARLLHGFDMSTPSGGPVNMSEGLGLSITKAGPLEVLLTGRLPSKLYE